MDPVLDTSAGPHHPSAPLPAPTSGTANKPLWAAVGVLGVAVAALGGTLLWQNVHGDDPTPQSVASAAGTAQQQTLSREDVLSERTNATPVPAPAPAPVVAAPAPKPAVSKPVVTAPRSGGSGYTGSYAPQAVASSRAPVCADCGRIESVTPIQQAAPATGLGAVAGGVLGAVLGNQVGGGSGRTAATILGAGGGAYLGNTVEKRTRTTTTYQIRVRMDDGSVRTYEHNAPVPVGQRVTVEGNGFRLGQGQTYSTHAAQNPYYQTVNEPRGTYSTSRY
ncbi:glycine zipper 2TM domain-containing protein [Xylophilus sp. GOD-11R]|uniref:glycine zipper 2TM domain-containing protein n=1 Tax=Xylophilus sp. GOD-11R TaxID=3089814 RepID=UPI00298D52C5|nr:glycine zipper 2TM domain-containing protein [Xylophilus sp. GOD-11R]WPB57119.1 glycine zipper 2TM domain-containing protein [Xylophilus sp. GOD-11R]